ncbi:hypothetical protein DPMN_112215 [Dreissena polymorpha]|uniref:C1q domain-containing protein n=1 Tax=Dreissena polymorpha TaxID=45954 RepID=A0A9D4QQN8_DREPO|nr:hypothetical protein DPMN_112215 [Dreissena polymorpha]
MIFFQVDIIINPNDSSSTLSSKTAVLGLIKGNAVWVSCNEGHVYGDNGFHGTTFTGALLY